VMLVFAVLRPSDSIALDKTFNSLECCDNQLFVAPRVGQSIYGLTKSNELNAIPVTDDVNYRIYDFEVTPFAIFINRGIAIEKYYISYGHRETIYLSRDISSFTITPSDEIILADRQNHEIIFLDFAYEEKFRIDNVKALDLQWSRDTVYALTKNNIYIYDEYGNQLEKKSIPERLDKIYACEGKVLLYSKSSNHVYRLDTEWKQTTLPFNVSDMCTKDGMLIILDGTGTTLYLYNNNDF
jgi:hypothetical protein